MGPSSSPPRVPHRLCTPRAAGWGNMAAKAGGAPRKATRGSWAPLITLTAAVILSCPAPASSICRHRIPAPEEVVYKVYQKTNHVFRRQADERLRMKIVYDGSIDDLVPARRRLVKEGAPYPLCWVGGGALPAVLAGGDALPANKLFPQAISYLQKTFQVRRPSSSILLSRYVCVCI
ncbi:unnamed protein product [Ranitomeya imitator]|uniref:Uncharacterized protein n=1 Tax=Ranitomeya imitator TaxID=111125 RepID=A0ABN9KUM3_9NEOB|nr:unnamed protein product [Ranitomeya imitator]